MSDRNPAVAGVVRWFDTGHHPGDIAQVSDKVADLVDDLLDILPDSPELTVGLRKLLEAKDCFVRCVVAQR